MKQKRIKLIVGFLIILIGLVVLNYPYVSGLINDTFAYKEIQGFEQEVKQIDNSERDTAIETANAYNKALAEAGDITPFKSFKYLQPNEQISTVEIPSIGVNMIVRYGTSNQVLDKGLGLVEDTSLPVGGPSTHAVISGHSGMASMKILTNLTSVKVGDVFFVHTLGIDMAYKVDQILVVEPWDNKDIAIVPGKDYVTLLTCTPYGVNSHRLLVRGERIADYDFSVPAVEQEVVVEERLSDVELMRRIIFYASIGIVGILLIVTIVEFFRKPKKKKKKAVTKKQVEGGQNTNEEQKLPE